MYLSSLWEALINSLKSGKLRPYTISTVVVSLKICFNVWNCRMPTLPLKPLSSSNNFSTYISFIPPWEKKKKTQHLTSFPRHISKWSEREHGVIRKAHPQPGLHLCPRRPQCGPVQKQPGGPVHSPRLRKPFLWKNLDSNICGRKAWSRPNSVCHFLGTYCRPESGHVMILLISHDSRTDVRGQAWPRSSANMYQSPTQVSLMSCLLLFLSFSSRPFLSPPPFFLPSLSSPLPPSPPVWLRLVIPQTSAEIPLCTRVQDERHRLCLQRPTSSHAHNPGARRLKRSPLPCLNPRECQPGVTSKVLSRPKSSKTTACREMGRKWKNPPRSPVFTEFLPIPRVSGNSHNNSAILLGSSDLCFRFSAHVPSCQCSGSWAIIVIRAHTHTHTLMKKKKSMQFEFLFPSRVFGKLL